MTYSAKIIVYTGLIAIALFVLVSSSQGNPPRIPTITNTDAFNKISNLPEVKAYFQKLGEVEKGVKPVIREESDNPDGNNLFEYYVGESHTTHSVLWNRFAVNRRSGEVFVFNQEEGEYIPINKWRHGDQ